VIAIAPYLGTMMSTHIIEAAGGLRSWHAPSGDLPLRDDDRLWRWLQRQSRDPPAPPLYLAYSLEAITAFEAVRPKPVRQDAAPRLRLR
jgi:hypothetical protein